LGNNLGVRRGDRGDLPPSAGILFNENGTGWTALAEFLLGAASSVLLPVVTLILGYYFSKEKNQ
jgi:hypothetical protein